MGESNLEPLVKPGGRVGILGGGQLARMMSLAATQLGLKSAIYADTGNVPAEDCAPLMVGDYEDEEALKRFAETVDVITYEFENVPARTVEILGAHGGRVAPGREALETSQDRLTEKEFINSIGAETAPFAQVDDLSSLQEALAKIGRPAILKTRRFGYDGKGQSRFKESSDGLEKDAARALDEIAHAPAILEGFVPFEREFSIIGARNAHGATAFFDAAENEHREGILRVSTVPAKLSQSALDKASEIVHAMLEALDYVGVIGVEFFALPDGRIVVNEFAPRVHNSGHWTQDACLCSQFEQHIRAICGWPLGDVTRIADAQMINLIGDEVDDWSNHVASSDAALHLYGKNEARPGRKMGHVNRIIRR